MKYRLLGLLKCIKCGDSPLKLCVFKKEDVFFDGNIQERMCEGYCACQEDNDGIRDCNTCFSKEIISGISVCRKCNAGYPIVNGVPRFNPDWYDDFPEYVEENKNALLEWMPSEFSSTGEKDFKKIHGKTKSSFGFQWLRYEVTDREEDVEDFHSKMGVKPDFLENKLILDGGCGMGRFLMVSSRKNNEVIGLDLSASVERAYKITKDLPFVYIIQGNLMNPPIREKILDFIYSLGVLHHTPDTKRAYQSICKLVKKGGRVSIWVYHFWVPPELKSFYKRAFARTREIIFDSIRKVTTRMPLKLLHYLCHIAIPLGWLQTQIHKSMITKILFWPLLLVYVRSHEKWQIRLLDTFDWYAPKYQWKHTYEEVIDWYREEKFEDIQRTVSHPVGVTGKKI